MLSRMETDEAFITQINPVPKESIRKQIKTKTFKIGRCKKADICMVDVRVSRSHCVISFDEGEWWITNESQLGTLVDDKLLGLNEKCSLFNDKIIQLGPGSDYKFKFTITSSKDVSPPKRPKIDSSTCITETSGEDKKSSESKGIIEEKLLKKENEDLNNRLQNVMEEKERIRLQYEEEKKRIENELITEKNALEQRLKEMETLLSSKELEQKTLAEKLKQTDEENLKLIALRHQTALQAETMVTSLKRDIMQKELQMRETLEVEMRSLLENRLLIEEQIRIEKEQAEGVCAEKLRTLEEELTQVKQDLAKTKGKQKLLKEEMQENGKEGSKDKLIAKREALSEFSNLIEMELQCSICNELFVKATTLSCTHTMCHFCLQQWKQKQRNCPMCRAPIVTESHSIVLDNFIDKIVENLSDELKTRRLQIIEERKGKRFSYKDKSRKKSRNRF